MKGRPLAFKGSDLEGIQQAILKTLKYSDHFHFPLTISELHTRLIEYKITQKKLISVVTELARSGTIEHHGNYYCLPGQSSCIKQRKLYARLSKPLRQYATSLIPILTALHSIKAIYLTGSLALSNTDGHDDIDLMIIVEDGKLWTTRALLTLYTTLLRLRRTPHTRNPMGKLCLNLYLTPKAFSLPLTNRSLYTAYELIQATPLYDPSDTHSALLAANPWIYEYLPNLKRTVPKRNSRVSPRSDLLRRRPKGVFSRLQSTIGRPDQTLLELTELICYHLQLLYMRPKITREHITPDSAFFHPNNPAPKV